MCGICGIVGKGSEDRDLLGRMCALLQHRGPDQNGFFFEENIALGHQRLSIIDLISGDQPIYNEDKIVAVVYNGEIYNYNDFRKDLMAKGHKFATRSDTEILVHAYEEYGTDFIKDLNGIFISILFLQIHMLK